jgi:hypothetical protein
MRVFCKNKKRDPRGKRPGDRGKITYSEAVRGVKAGRAADSPAGSRLGQG